MAFALLGISGPISTKMINAHLLKLSRPNKTFYLDVDLQLGRVLEKHVHDGSFREVRLSYRDGSKLKTYDVKVTGFEYRFRYLRLYLCELMLNTDSIIQKLFMT